MCGGGFLAVGFVWAAEWVWAGRGLLLAEGMLVVLHVFVWGGWLVVFGVEDTSSCFCFLRLCGGWGWWVPLRVVGVACCRGSGAVRPGCLVCVLLPFLRWWGVGVGGLVVNCIVDASILL